ncbi:MAG: proline--tRNA ligase [Elusimicrobia bacterium RIFCSPLOWO2_01_FULL_60_11]|nr:MAG: proline--tRNA ligase [Elusimicrobia bacterium RIFCSPLOWO2_01_FULL_60_11]
MKASRLLAPTLREAPRDTDAVSAKLMIRAGLIRKLAAGLYDWLPLGLRALKKAENIVRQEMDKLGAQEVWLPTIQPKELWEETGRWQVYGKELLRFKDRKDTEFCYAPTAEEVITDLVRRDVNSYRQLPLALYQFGSKFRDELRPRFGVMRAREFYMKDCYSFHATEADAEDFYKKAYEAYVKIFERCGFKFRAVEADSGAIGGSFSHEFMVLAETGEDEIISCEACGYGANREKHGTGTACPKCNKEPLMSSRGIEVGHTFKLGTKYSDAMKAMYLDASGAHKPFIMGCYGIGVSRVVAAAIEQGNDENGIIWTQALAPYQVVIIPTNYAEPKIKEWADKFYEEVQKLGVDAVLDDRDERAGVKFKDADLIGYPLRITLGEKGLAKGIAEVKPRSEKNFQEIPLDNVLTEVQKFFNS